MLIESTIGADAAQRKRIARAAARGELRRIARGIYTPDLDSRIEDICRRHAFELASLLFPGAVIGYRTAIEGKPTEGGEVWLTHRRTTTRTLPGIVLRSVSGPGPLPGDMPLPRGLYMASVPRFLLENLTPSRARKGERRSLGGKAVESYLDRTARIRGEDEIKRIRAAAEDIAPELGLEKQRDELNKIIDALLGSRDDAVLTTPAGKARAKGLPADHDRLQALERIAIRLHAQPLPSIGKPQPRDSAFRINAAFFESYFSNYVEGTRFELEEAFEIAIENKIPQERPQDAHDILGLFRLLSDESQARTTPQNSDEMLGLLQDRHRSVFSERPEIQPGQFKLLPNRAGSYQFVAPDDVPGTLKNGFKIIAPIKEPVARAILTHQLITEVHPFSDGNGRLARVFMNAELCAAGLARVLIANVFRDDYLGAVRLLSRDGVLEPFVRMVQRGQYLHTQTPFGEYAQAAEILRRCNAFKEPDEGYRLRLPNEI